MFDKEFQEDKYECCPVCSGEINCWRVKNVGTKLFKIDQCRSCRFTFVNPRPSWQFILTYYNGSGHGCGTNNKAPTLESVRSQELREPNSVIDANRIVKTCNALLRDAAVPRKLLDVGCGYGFFSNQALCDGFRVTALEMAQIERQIAIEMTKLDIIASSFEEFNSTAGSFDVILMSQILEHALDVNVWIEKASQLVRTDGLVVIAVPNFGSIFRMIMQENEPFIIPPAHLNFFQYKSLSKLLERHRFIIEKTQWVSRIPKSAFEKHLKLHLTTTYQTLHTLSSMSLKIIDTLRLGMFINVYARKSGN
ncbi:MAG: class I SAM-dependent methyltransferase [Candidatus Pacebacteria bacterium]|nr:class I SAM-dependent methyltransferase [Candidatus Paceibacterota bacterium]